MAKKIRAVLTLQLPAGKATPAPPVGTALGPHGINIVEFCKTYNERTAAQAGQVIPAQITIFEDRSFTFILKTPPAADLLRKAAGVEKGSETTGRERVGTVTRAQVREIAESQDGRPERGRPGGSLARRRGHRPIDGHRGRRLRPAGAEGQETSRVRWEAPGRQKGEPMPIEARIPGRSSSSTAGPYEPMEAATVLKETSKVNFDPSVEAHIRLGVDPRHADQMVRGTVVLPHGVGKPVRVVVFAQADKAQEALRAGADEVGGEDLVKRIEAGWLEFDIALATPDMMGVRSGSSAASSAGAA